MSVLMRTTFTALEIAKAAGKNDAWVRRRIKILVESGQLPDDQADYTYDQVKQIIRVRIRARAAKPEKVDLLKRQLIDDGMAHK